MEKFVYSIIPEKTPLNLDIMLGNRWRGCVSFPCTPGAEYSCEELKAFVRMKMPSLTSKAFDVIPTSQPVFKN